MRSAALASGALALLAAGCGGGGGGARAVAPSPIVAASPAGATGTASNGAIWFHPMPPPSAGSTEPIAGSADFTQLFVAGAAWPKALAQTHVIGLYAGWVTLATDAVLDPIVAFLNANGIAIELEAPSLQATATCGTNVEGYAPYGTSIDGFTLGYLNRLKALNANVAYLKVDEPYWYGHVVAPLSASPGACSFSIATVASEVASFTQLAHTVYPALAVGDVEPVIAAGYTPDVVTDLSAWHTAYAAANGAPFPFFIADTDWSNPAWPTIDASLEAATHAQGLRFGIIYIGDMTDTTDAEWIGKAAARFTAFQVTGGNRPDFVLFQSWENHPLRCLPESDPTTFTGLLDSYLAT